jgi:isoquinoline 1-oxidoreductase
MKPQQAIGAPITGEPIETVRQTPPENRNDRLAPTRRDLFRLLGAGLLIGVALPEAEGQESGGGRRRGGGGGVPQQINAWLHIAANGEVTAYTGKVDVGQNSRTALTQAVAEELRVPVASIRFVMGDTDLTPYDMGTFGSRTTPTMNPILRRAAAAAREQLLGMAAERWQVDRGQLTAAEGHITHTATQRRNAYGDLLQGQQLTQIIPTDIALTPAAQWRVLGTPVPKVDGRAFVTGQHRYASDMRREGMLFGRILRPVAYGAKLKSLDDGAARKMPGVTVVHDGDFVGVVAPTTHAADRALAALKAEWTTTPQPSDKDLYALLHPQTNSGEHENNGTGNQAVGNKTVGNGATVQGANGSGEHRLQATYTVAYIAHAPLEPRAAVAEWNAAGHLTVWTGTQRPFGVRGDLAAALGIPESRVRVIVPDTGSGYGGKHTGEAAIEAALLARVAGRPVRLVWTREEEFTWAYFRPAGVIDVAATVDANGALTAWEFTNYNSGGSAIESPYHISGQRCEFRPAPSPLRQGSYRGLAGTANHFAASRTWTTWRAVSIGTRWPFASKTSRTTGCAPFSSRRPTVSDGMDANPRPDAAMASRAARKRAAISPTAPRYRWITPPGRCG